MWQRVLLWTLAALHLPILAASIWVAMNAGQIEKELQVESSAHLFQISALLPPGMEPQLWPADRSCIELRHDRCRRSAALLLDQT
jgi:hypothetical protein